MGSGEGSSEKRMSDDAREGDKEWWGVVRGR